MTAGPYYILSLRWTRGDLLCWWCPDNSGYTTLLARAGRYEHDIVAGMRAYYDNGETTIAIPCADVDQVAELVVVSDLNLEKLTKRRFAAMLYNPDAGDCDACGQSTEGPRVGLRIVGPETSTGPSTGPDNDTARRS